jgi:DamX protein
MDNRKVPDPQAALKAEDLRLAEQVARHRNDSGAPPPAREMPGNQAQEPEIDTPPVAQLARVSADQVIGRDQLRDAEISLVDRIADVDDERRRATARLQRTWQSHQEEVDARLRRQGRKSAIALLLLTLVGASIVFLAFDWLRGQQLQLAQEFATTKAEPTRRPVPKTRDTDQDPRLERLSARVDELSTALAELTAARKQTTPTEAQGPDGSGDTDAQLAAEIREHEARQRLAAQELDSLRNALDATTTADRAGIDGNSGASDEVRADGGGLVVSSPGSVPAITEPPRPEDKQTLEAATDDGIDDHGNEPGIQETRMRITDRRFALQLIGFYSRDPLSKFAGRDDLPAQIYTYRETVNGRPWFSVIHSLHASVGKAADQISRLPTELEALSPWIRPMQQGTELEVLTTGEVRAAPAH